MKKILFPIDGSDFAKTTLQWAGRFLNRDNFAVYLLIVSEALDVDYRQEDLDRILSETGGWFKKCGFNVAKADCITNRKAAEAICEYADRENVDHIIIGSHGKQFAQMFIGSVSRSVLENAHQPVLVLSNTRISLPEGPQLEQCPPKGLPLRVLLPVDSISGAKAIIPTVEGLFDKEAILFHVLHVIDITSENPVSATWQLTEAGDLVSQNKQALESAGFQVEHAGYRPGYAVDEICKYADENAIDQIAVLSRNRSNLSKFLFGSVSSGLMKHAKQPVLAFGLGPGSVSAISAAEDRMSSSNS